jgi:hypothetical protein
MRIIERKNQINSSILYVVQAETWGNKYSMLNPQVADYAPRKEFTDIRAFATLEEAKAFLFQYENNLKPGERIVS